MPPPRCGPGPTLLVFLDVDCLAEQGLLASYEAAASRSDPDGPPALLSGAVAYLPPLPPGATSYPDDVLAAAAPHPARPAPGPGVLEPGDARLFWSLSFAVTATHWARLPGFDEGYAGLRRRGHRLRPGRGAAGAGLWWVGGALARHQWHPVSDPPVEHLEDIVANANRFHGRWGWFPMGGGWRPSRRPAWSGWTTRHGAWACAGAAEKRPRASSSRGRFPAPTDA